MRIKAAVNNREAYLQEDAVINFRDPHITTIPTGFCYQKLILDDEAAPYPVYHGFNGVYTEEYGKWIRLDARGNTNGINAQ